MSRIRPYLRMAREFSLLMAHQFRDKGLQKSAASLTYVTLFAIVPLMTVTYSMFSIIPAFQGVGDQLQQLIFRHLLPETGQELISYLQDFSKQARNLTIVGVLFLMGSAYIMLSEIEQNFNTIWGGLRGRKGIANFLLYWAVLSMGPLLLGIGLAMSTYLMSLRLLMDAYDGLGIIALVFEVAPMLLTVAAFTLLFLTVPNCKVPFTHGLAGGIVTALVFELLKVLFALVVTHTSVTLIYGAFAIVPLFLIWVNLMWVVILGGAVLVRCITLYQIGRRDRGYSELLATLLVLWEFHQASINGERLDDRALLSKGLSEEQWQRIRTVLHKNNVIVTTNQDELVLCHDLHVLTLQQVTDMLMLPRLMPEAPGKLQELPWFAGLELHLGGIDRVVSEHLDITVIELFEERNEPADAEVSDSPLINNPI